MESYLKWVPNTESELRGGTRISRSCSGPALLHSVCSALLTPRLDPPPSTSRRSGLSAWVKLGRPCGLAAGHVTGSGERLGRGSAEHTLPSLFLSVRPASISGGAGGGVKTLGPHRTVFTKKPRDSFRSQRDILDQNSSHPLASSDLRPSCPGGSS